MEEDQEVHTDMEVQVEDLQVQEDDLKALLTVSLKLTKGPSAQTEVRKEDLIVLILVL